MEKKPRLQIVIPVFYHENENGRIIIDNEYMREYFENQLQKLFLETKLGREKFYKEKLKKQKNENRRTNKRSRQRSSNVIA